MTSTNENKKKKAQYIGKIKNLQKKVLFLKTLNFLQPQIHY